MADAKHTQRLAEGVAAMKRGDFAAADTILRTALQRQPNDPETLHWAGVLYVTTARPLDAVVCFDRLTRLRPRDAAAHANLARTRLSTGDANGGLDAAERALTLQPHNTAALAAKADCLNHLGRTDEAIALLEPIMARGEEDSFIAQVLAGMLANTGRHEDAAKLARRHFESTAEMDPGQRRLLGFTLGQSLDALDRVDEAFDAFVRANAVQLPGARFNPDEFVRGIDAQIDLFTPAKMRGLIRASSRSDLPVMVCGIARSGTTLIEQIIHAHPLGFGAGELPMINQIAQDIGMRLGSMHVYPQCLVDLDEQQANAIGSEYVAHMRALAPLAQRVVDKNLMAMLHIGLIWQILPAARVIHCRRDPVANGLACFIAPLSPRIHPYASSLEHIGLVIRECERLMTHWKRVLDLPILTVQYEELVADQQGISRQMITHIGLDWNDACLRYHEARRVVRTLSYDQVRRPMYTSALQRHARYERYLAPLKRALEG